MIFHIGEVIVRLGIDLNPHDIWIGVYWRYSAIAASAPHTLTFFVCIVPMVPIKIGLGWGGKRE